MVAVLAAMAATLGKTNSGAPLNTINEENTKEKRIT